MYTLSSSTISPKTNGMLGRDPLMCFMAFHIAPDSLLLQRLHGATLCTKKIPFTSNNKNAKLTIVRLTEGKPWLCLKGIPKDPMHTAVLGSIYQITNSTINYGNITDE